MVIDSSALVAAIPREPEAGRFGAAMRRARRRYIGAPTWKGVGNPGVLNFGDCLAYGVAKALGEPLLSKGDDFTATDVEAAPY